MPRTGKGQVAPGEPYGQRAQLEEQMAASPMAGNQPPDLHQAAVQGAAAMPPPPEGGLLKGPSTRPNEPITAGADFGPGPGRPAQAMGSKAYDRKRVLAEQIQMAAELTGNPRLQRMAQRMVPRQDTTPSQLGPPRL